MRFDPATDARCEKLTMDPIGFGHRERLGIVVVAAFAVSAASVAYAKGLQLSSPLPINWWPSRTNLDFRLKCTCYSKQQLLLKVVCDNLQSNG